jgi:signal transduction histidine kinase
MRSLAGRLAALQQGMTLLVIVVFAGSALWLTGHVLRDEQMKIVSDAARQLARGYEEELEEQGNAAAAAASVIEDVAPGIRAEIVDPTGRVLARSASAAPAHVRSNGAAPPPSRPETFAATARAASGVVIRVAMTDALERANLAALGRSLVISALPLLIASLLLGRWIARRALEPLSTMAARAAEIPVERGVRSLGRPTGLEEIDRLAQSFDRLLERLDDALRAERRLTADASHELRTPLTVLSGELEMLREQARRQESIETSLATASDQVRAMRELVEAILLLHHSGEAPRAGEGAFEPVNLADLAREVAAESRPRYQGRDRDLSLSAPDEVLVPGHPALLASALRNLVDNALKFTRAGEPVSIAVRDGADTSTVIVEDGGPGIPEREKDRIFDPFFRGAEARAGGSGFGLGLPILRRVARAHGGDVSVEVSPLGGARFVLELPSLGRGS